MGSDCLSTTVHQRYADELETLRIPQLKDLWQTVKLYKIKKMYDTVAVPHPDYPSRTQLDMDGLRKLLPEFAGYPEALFKRVFEIFDIESQGFVDWNSFFSTISICYFAPENILSILVFMIFDTALEKKLNQSQVQLLVSLNLSAIKTSEETDITDEEEIVQALMEGINLKVQDWQKKVNNWFDLTKMRRLFNIFQEQRLQKELVKHFSQWNCLYDPNKGKHVSYLVNMKWFQSWKLYIQQHYGVGLSLYATGHPPTTKTIKTVCKTFKKLKASKIATNKALNATERTFDYIHNNIGQRPRQISNGLLEGEFQEILRAGLTENMDYVLVSQNVWNHLKAIYDGSPEFRRTGYGEIQLYPKVVRIFSVVFKGQIDYSSQVIRQVSAYLRIDQLLTHSIEIPAAQLAKKAVFFKTIGMTKWEEISDLSYLFTQLTSQVLIFMIYINAEERESFKRTYQRAPKDVIEVNIGDFMKYIDPHTKKEQQVVFMGKSTEGKYILHFHGQPYTQDLCLLEVDFLKTCHLSPRVSNIPGDRKQHTELVGLPGGRETGFVGSTILQLLDIKSISQQLSLLDSDKNDNLMHVLSKIQELLSLRKKVQSQDLVGILEAFLPQFRDFDLTMCADFLQAFLMLISSELKEYQNNNCITDLFKVTTNRTQLCQHCHRIDRNDEESLVLRVPLTETEQVTYEVIWVPSEGENYPIKYAFKLGRNAKLSEYLSQFQRVAEVTGRKYLLAQVLGHDIVKNYQSASRNFSLRQLKLRETDQIFAYQIQQNFEGFVSEHYSSRENITEGEIKKDQFIDVYHSERGWIFGKVTELQYLPYTQSTVVRVLHKFSKNESWQISYDVFEGIVAKFPLKSFKLAEQYALRLQQRTFNEASNQMQLIAQPLVVVLTSWMRWREFFYLVYLQLRPYIIQDIDSEPQESLITRRRTQKPKPDKFRDYKASSRFPYVLRLADYDGRCAICFKFLKSIVFKGQNELYCDGCTLSQSQPIAWQVKPADLMICVDWKNPSSCRLNPVQSHSSLAQLKSSVSGTDSLTNCLKKLQDDQLEQEESLCCNTLSIKKVKRKILGLGEMVAVYLERVVQQEDGFRKVLHKRIDFGLQGVRLGGGLYDLVGVTAVEGDQSSLKYKTYLLRKGQGWFEYDGRLVRAVNQSLVEKVEALCLYYHRASK